MMGRADSLHGAGLFSMAGTIGVGWVGIRMTAGAAGSGIPGRMAPSGQIAMQALQP